MKYILFLCAFLVNFLSFAATIAAGSSHSIILDEHGSVWTFGEGFDGQLGHGNNVYGSTVPRKIENIPLITAVAAGMNHSIILDEDGFVWTFGIGFYGQLGDGRNAHVSGIPQKIENIPLITAVAAGAKHSMLLDIDGSVWTFGEGIVGQLGHGDNNALNRPKKIENIPLITAVAAGAAHSMLLDIDGFVWTFGSGKKGQLGRKCKDYFCEPTLKKIEGLPFITTIAAGYHHSIVIDKNGEVWTFGDNEFEQLGRKNRIVDDGTPDKLQDFVEGLIVTAVAGGEKHNIILDNVGSVWTFGSSPDGQLGDGIRRGANRKYNNLNDHPTLITAIAAGNKHNLLLDIEGSVWTFGNDYYSQLGQGQKNNPYGCYTKPMKIKIDPSVKIAQPNSVDNLHRWSHTKSARGAQ